MSWRAAGTRLDALRRDLKALLGIPDYGRYLEHMALRHPGAPVLTERDFHARAIDGRYGGTRPRCC